MFYSLKLYWQLVDTFRLGVLGFKEKKEIGEQSVKDEVQSFMNFCFVFKKRSHFTAVKKSPDYAAFACLL